jgi:heptosyltransferase-2
LNKFLIIRFSSIGDIVLTTPVVRCLKLQVAGAEVHFLTKKGFASILQPNPYIDKLHLLEDDLQKTIRLLKDEKYDYIIDLHHNLRTLRVKLGLGVKSFSFDKLNTEKWLFTALKVNRLPDIHIVDRYLSTLNSFGVYNDGKGLDFFISEKDRVSLENLPESFRHGFIALVLGATFATKQLPVEKLDLLCSLLKQPVILFGGPTEKEMGEAIAQKHPHSFNASGKFSLAQSADLLRQSAVVITHDTGLMHIAAAFQKPVISIWGNTVPEFGMGPYFGENAATQSRLFEVKNLSCRPCSKIGYKKCPKGHFNCMQLQDIASIANEANGLIDFISSKPLGR